MREDFPNPERQPSGKLISEFHRLIMDACPVYADERELDGGAIVIGRDASMDDEVYAMRTLDITGLPSNQYAHRAGYTLSPDFKIRRDYHFVHLSDIASQAEAILDAEQLRKVLGPEVAEKVLGVGESAVRAYRLLDIRLGQMRSHETSGETQVSDEDLQRIITDIKRALELDS